MASWHAYYCRHRRLSTSIRMGYKIYPLCSGRLRWSSLGRTLREIFGQISRKLWSNWRRCRISWNREHVRITLWNLRSSRGALKWITGGVLVGYARCRSTESYDIMWQLHGNGQRLGHQCLRIAIQSCFLYYACAHGHRRLKSDS